MLKKDLFKKMFEDNNLSKDEMRDIILTKAETNQTDKKEGKNMFKNILKFALPAAMVFGVMCFQIIGGNIMQVVNPDSGTAETKSNNWFSLVAYAADDTPIEITNDIKPIPLGKWEIGSNGLSFTIDGENIKYVNFKSESGTVDTNISTDFKIYNTDGEPFTGCDSLIVTLEEPVSIEHEFSFHDSKNSATIIAFDIADDFSANITKITWLPGSNLKNDIITVTAEFDDGEVITQIVEITIDENTGEMFAQIIG